MLRALERLDELELHLALPSESVPQRELYVRAVVTHFFQPRRLEPVTRPRADGELVAPAAHGLVEVLHHQGALFERRLEQRRTVLSHMLATKAHIST